MPDQVLSCRQFTKSFLMLGPYLRLDQTDETRYFFDCLSVCVNLKVEAEHREFWGWWLTLVPSEAGFSYETGIGLFSRDGIWQNIEPAPGILEEVERTREHFMTSLDKLVAQWDLLLHPRQNGRVKHLVEV